jgi:hypothetical protein
VCTDHTGEVFFECQKAGREIFKELAEIDANHSFVVNSKLKVHQMAE